MRHLLHDIRYALRTLLHAPLFTLGVVLTLALGIGVNSAMFGVVDALFLRSPAGVREASSIVRVYGRRINGTETWTGSSFGYPSYEDLHDAGIFAELAATATRSMSLGRGAEAIGIKGLAVSQTYFPMLGITPALGRFFDASEDQVGADKRVVLSHAFWLRHFGGDRGVLGRALPMGKGTYTVVGVAQPGFAGADIGPVDVWVPIRSSAEDLVGKDGITSRGWIWLQMLGKLKPGTRMEDVANLATTAFKRGALSSERARRDSSTTILLGPIQAARGPEAGSNARVSAWVGGVAIIVLLIACANVANLLLARGVTRRRELAVRAGLGAGRGGLIRLLLAESLVIAVLGGVAALGMTMWTGSAVRSFLVPNMPADLPFIDLRVLAFTSLAVLVTLALAGALPSILSSRTSVADALKSGGRSATGRTGGTRSALLALQVAMTLVLLVGAGLFVRSLRNVQGLDLGVQPEHVVTANMDLDAAGIRDEAADQTYLRILERVRNLPSVGRAAAVAMPWGWGWGTDLKVEGVDTIPDLPGGGPYLNVVTPDYFAVLGTRLTRGRGFTTTDRAGGEPVAIVNETMARTLWRGGAAVGKCLYTGDSTAIRTCRRIVGVFATARRGGVIEPPTMQYFVPYGQYALARLHGLVVRPRGEAGVTIAAVRGVIQSEGNLPYATIGTLADGISEDYRSWRLGAAAFTAFGTLALVIAAMGIFAVISYSVSQRIPEIGIRLALGAESGDVVRMILGQGLRPTALGLLAGVAGAWALGRGSRRCCTTCRRRIRSCFRSSS